MKFVLPLAVAGTSVLLAACGGGSDTPDPQASQATAQASSQASAEGTVPVLAGPTVQQRTAAAAAVVATNPNCTSLTPFYWEIGDKTGRLASGTGGTATSGQLTPTVNTPLPLASASKWIFGTWVVEKNKGVLNTAIIKGLTMTAGYTNANDCSSGSSVASCLTEPGRVGGTNGDYNAYLDGRFYYNSGHMQVLASNVGLGPDTNSPLASAVNGIEGLALGYANPTLAGGAKASAATYTKFLRNMLNGTYQYMPSLLGSNAVCTHTNSTDCPSAAFNPLNESHPGQVNDVSNEAWHYSLGHWVEDDPTVGDGAFSSTGHLGYYPWIDKSKTWYGVIARFDPTNTSNIPAGQLSMQCGRLVRAAWVNPPVATQ